MVGCLYVFDGGQFHIKRLQHSAATVAWSVSFRVTLSRSLLQDHHRLIITRRPSASQLCLRSLSTASSIGILIIDIWMYTRRVRAHQNILTTDSAPDRE